MPFFEKNLSKNIPRGEKEIGLKMESEKSSSLSLPRRMRRSREQLYLRIKCSSPRRIVQKSWFSFGETRGAKRGGEEDAGSKKWKDSKKNLIEAYFWTI